MLTQRKRAYRAFLCLVATAGMAVLLSPNVSAQLSARVQQSPEIVAITDWGTIASLSSAWAQDAMNVHHNAPFVNSKIRSVAVGGGARDECSTTNDGYATDVTDPGHKLHHAILVGAFLNGKQVRLILQGCSYNRPRIIAVEVKG